VILLAAAFLVILAASQTAAVGGFLRQLLPNNPSQAAFPDFPEITEPPSPPTTAASPSGPANSESPGRSDSTPSSVSPASRQSPSSPPSAASPPGPTSPSPEPGAGGQTLGGGSTAGRTFATGLGWVASALGDGADSTIVNGVASSPAGFVAVGSSSGGGTAWTSPDGVAWTAHGIPGATELRRVATGPDRTVAVGGDQIWISPDGESWRPAAHGPAQGSDLVDVAYGNGAFIAIGRTGPGSTYVTLWTSTDGDSWTRLPDSPNLANFCPHAVAAGAFAVVIVGDDCATSPPHAVVASSADLSHWTRQAGAPPTYQARSLAAVTASDRRFITGGTVDVPGGPGQAFYSSDDGVTWKRHGTFRPPGATESIRGVTRLGSGYIGVGLRDPQVADLPTTWTSADGLTWARGDLLPVPSFADKAGRTVTGVAANGNRVVVVGTYTSGPNVTNAIAWTAELPR
jgi:hypothetical protein